MGFNGKGTRIDPARDCARVLALLVEHGPRATDRIASFFDCTPDYPRGGTYRIPPGRVRIALALLKRQGRARWRLRWRDRFAYERVWEATALGRKKANP